MILQKVLYSIVPGCAQSYLSIVGNYLVSVLLMPRFFLKWGISSVKQFPLCNNPVVTVFAKDMKFQVYYIPPTASFSSFHHLCSEGFPASGSRIIQAVSEGDPLCTARGIHKAIHWICDKALFSPIIWNKAAAPV